MFKKFYHSKVLEYKAGLKKRNKFVYVAMCSLVMSLCSHDLPVTSLIAITIHWINSGYSLHSTWFLNGIFVIIVYL